MASKSLKKLIALVTMATMIAPNAIASAQTTDNSIESDDSNVDFNAFDKNSDGVLKVNVDDNGKVKYQEPVKTALEVKPEKGKWGDKVYTEDRPFSWDDINLYFTITDRFVNGDSSNDHSYGRSEDQNGKAIDGFDTAPATFHGGDLKGLTSKIEDGYFDNLGTNVIWFTAAYEQVHGKTCGKGFFHYPFHGYWVLDYTNMDENMGTEDDMEKFVETAHKHGIRVVMDIVMNHAGYANATDAKNYGYGGLADGWEDIYYGPAKNIKDYVQDYSSVAEKNGCKGILDSNADWTNFWGTKWVRLCKKGEEGVARFGSYEPTSDEGGPTDLTCCTSGLPDFRTETDDDPGMPVFYSKVWSPDKLEKENKEIDEFCDKYGKKRKLVTYLEKWLSDWVLKYGLDGFRCDTAKHVEKENWKDLQEVCNKRLNEWRKNNPNKPGAKWTDDFWMTGEHWGHGLEKDGYYSNGFASMINFSYQGKENATGEGLENTFSSYASAINSDPSFNVLSYISSHDKSLGTRSANAGTALLLTPGGVQTFYGDETGRKYQNLEWLMGTRTNMNWDSIDENILSNWQKVGQFRSDHIAVGAGAHKKLNEEGEPYSFSRIYHEGKDDEDKVVVSLPGAGGEQVVNCGDTFEDGTTLIDYYTGKDYDVSGGKVTVEADDSGVVLLSQGKPSTKASVSASCKDAKSGKYYGDSATVTLNVNKAETGTYSIDGGEEKTFKNGDEITIGEDAKPGEVTRIQLKATGSEDPDKQEIHHEYMYQKAEESTDIPRTDALVIHAKDSKNFKSGVNAYVYVGAGQTEKEKLLGAWPGTAMEKDENGWYTIEVPTKEKANIIFNGSFGQNPEKDQSPADFTRSGEGWYLDGKWYSTNPDNLSINSFSADQYKVEKGNDVKLTAAATGSGAISYEFFNGDESIGTSDDGTITWTPDKDGTYKIKVVATDASKKTQSVAMTYTVGKGGIVNPPSKEFSIKSVVSDAKNNTITVGDTAVITANAENADGDVQYKFEAEDGEDQDYSDDNTFKFKPDQEGTFTVTVTAKDDSGKEVTKDITITVKKAEEDLSISVQSKPNTINVGETAAITAEPQNAKGDVQYKFEASDGESQDYSDSNTFKFKPEKAGTYKVTVTAKDERDKEVTKEISITVNKEGTVKDPVTLSSFTADPASSQEVNKSVTLVAQSKDGVGSINYTFYVDGKKVQSNSSNKYVWTPSEAKEYELKVEAVDEDGNKDTKTMNYTVTKAQTGDFEVSITPDKESAKVGDTVTFTLGSKNADDEVYYTVTIDGKKQTVKDNKVTWTPDQDGTFNVKVTGKCGEQTQTKEIEYKVAAKTEDPKNPNSGDSRNAVALGVLGTMGIGYVLASRKKKNLN